MPRLTELPPVIEELPARAQVPPQQVLPLTATSFLPDFRPGADTTTLEMPEGALKAQSSPSLPVREFRSEERRVGKEC